MALVNEIYTNPNIITTNTDIDVGRDQLGLAVKITIPNGSMSPIDLWSITGLNGLKPNTYLFINNSLSDITIRLPLIGTIPGTASFGHEITASNDSSSLSNIIFVNSTNTATINNTIPGTSVNMRAFDTFANTWNVILTGGAGTSPIFVNATAPINAITLGNTTTIGLNTSGVVAGSYTNASITVDVYGRISAASSNASGITSITGSNPIIASTIGSNTTISHATSGVIAGSYTNATITVNSTGHISAASSGSIGITTINATNPIIANTVGSTTNLTFANSGVVAGSYVNSSITVDVFGRITSASSGSVGVSTINGTLPIIATTSGGGTISTISLANSGVVAGSYTYSSITVNAQGLITSASNGSAPVSTVSATAPIISSGGVSPNISLANSGVVAGSYTYSSITVDVHGLITSASNGSAPVSTVSATAPIISSGGVSPNISLANSGVVAGSYTLMNATVDVYGRITSASNSNIVGTLPITANTVAGTTTIALFNSGVVAGSYTYSSITVNAQGLITSAANGTVPVSTVSATAPIVSSGGISPNISLANSGVTIGTYNYSTITVDAHGLITSASTGTISSGNAPIIVNTVGSATTISHSTSTVVAGSYTSANITVDTFGHITAASNGGGGIASVTASAPISSSGGANPNITLNNSGVVAGSYVLTSLTVDAHGLITTAANGTITGLGPITSSTVGNNTNISLNNSGVVAGSYTSTNLTVDVYGRITAASNGGGGVASVSASTPIASTGGVNPVISLNTSGVVAGSYTNTSLTVDVYGRITAASSGSIGFTTINGTAPIIATTSGGGTISTISLANSGVIAGSYTNTSLTVDVFGRITSASSGSVGITTITGTSPITSTLINPTTYNITHDLSTVIAGSYTSANITVDAWGHITAASNGSGGGGGSVASVTASAPIASSGGANPNITHLTSGVVSGSYTLGSFTVDTYGHITAANSNTISGTAPINAATVGTNTTISLNNSGVVAGSYTYSSITVNAQGLITAASSGTTAITSVTASSPLSSSGGSTPNITHNNSGVSAGSYTFANITVNATGHITSASSGTAVASVSGSSPIISSGGSNPVISLATSGVSPGSYTNTNLTVDVYGRITAASNGATSITTINGVAPISASTFAGTTTISHNDSTVVIGSYTNANITVDQKGHITAASNGSSGVLSVGATSPIISSGGLNPNISHATSGATAGSYTYANITVNATGHITAVSSNSTPITNIFVNNPILSTGGSSPTISHATSGVVAGSYTSANITVDSFGHITAAANGSSGSPIATPSTLGTVYGYNSNVGFSNDAYGYLAGNTLSGSSGQNNVLVGPSAGEQIANSANRNTVVGSNGSRLILSNDNVAIGYNTAVGYGLSSNRNIGIGNSVATNTSGGDNVVVGHNSSSNGSNNNVIGSTSGSNGSGNIVIGYNSNASGVGPINSIVIGFTSISSGNNSIVIGPNANSSTSNEFLLPQIQTFNLPVLTTTTPSSTKFPILWDSGTKIAQASTVAFNPTSQSWSPTITGLTLGATAITGTYIVFGPLTTAFVKIVFGAGFNITAALQLTNFPVAVADMRRMTGSGSYFHNTATNGNINPIPDPSTNQVFITTNDSSTAPVSTIYINSNTIPIAWVAGDSISFSLTYM